MTILSFSEVYEINLLPIKLDSKISLLNFLFGAIKLTENEDLDKYSYPGYDIGSDIRGNV